jgi:catalase
VRLTASPRPPAQTISDGYETRHGIFGFPIAAGLHLYSERMRDNTRTPLDRGPKGLDERALNVESARFVVEASNVHGSVPPEALPGGRPAHTAGVFLKGTFQPLPASEPFTSPIFADTPTGVLARFSPLRTVNEKGRYDLHGLSVRLRPGNNGADYTDLVAINTHPFMVRTADEFATVTRLLRSRSLRDRANGVTEFAAATVAGDASLYGLARAGTAALRGNRKLTGRSFWGIHTFFADRYAIENGEQGIRVPYRYRLSIWDHEQTHRKPSKGRVLAKYRDLVHRVNDGYPLNIDLWFGLPWRWSRLTDWEDVPETTRLDLINPQAVWKNAAMFHMGRIELTSVVDGEAAWGRRTKPDRDALLFDPTRLTDGLHISEDPMLIALSSIYAESHMRRT